MRRHPAYRAKLEWMIADAQSWRSTDELYRLLAEADAFMGGVPESPEVRQERLDREACALASSNAEPRPEPVPPLTWRQQVVPVLGIIGAFTVVAWVPAIAEGIAGWLL